MSERSDDDSTPATNVDKQNIHLSEHVKDKIRYRRATTTTPLSSASDDVFLGSNDDDESESTLTTTSSRHQPLKRDSTFTTFQIQTTRRTPIESQPFAPFERKSTLKNEEFCLECQRRDELLNQTNQRITQMRNDNRRLFEQLRSSVLLNHQYQEENYRLKIRLNQLNNHLRQYESNIEVLRKNLQMKNSDHLQRLRQEVHQYNQMIAAKRQNDFYSHSKK